MSTAMAFALAAVVGSLGFVFSRPREGVNPKTAQTASILFMFAAAAFIVAGLIPLFKG